MLKDCQSGKFFFLVSFPTADCPLPRESDVYFPWLIELKSKLFDNFLRCIDQYGQPIMRVLKRFKGQDSAKQNHSGQQEGKSTKWARKVFLFLTEGEVFVDADVDDGSTTSRSIDLHQHLSKFNASNTQGPKTGSSNTNRVINNNFKKFVRSAGSGSAGIKPMPIPRWPTQIASSGLRSYALLSFFPKCSSLSLSSTWFFYLYPVLPCKQKTPKSFS